MLAVTTAFSLVLCRDPGFITPIRLEIPQLSQQAGTDSVTETKSRHNKQIDSVASNVGLLQKDGAKGSTQTDSSLLATNPALPSPRELMSGQRAESDGQASKEDDSTGQMPPANALPSENDSNEEESNNERVEGEMPEAGGPSAPIVLPVRSEAKTLNVETRFCVLCSMEQPLRARHCRSCNRCVALYDHHCPWLGVCVAERNRFRFFWYLVAESVLLWYSVSVVRVTQGWSAFQSEPDVFQWLQQNGPLLLVEATVGVFSVLVTALLCFHIYLASSSITTWECISWGKIPYLHEWPRAYGSPFSRGLLLNLSTYCCLPLQHPHTVWTLPQTLPTSAPRRCVCC